MADLINLRRARKAKGRADAAKTAEVHRASFGRGKIEKQETAARETLATRRFEGHKRDKPGDDA